MTSFAFVRHHRWSTQAAWIKFAAFQIWKLPLAEFHNYEYFSFNVIFLRRKLKQFNQVDDASVPDGIHWNV